MNINEISHRAASIDCGVTRECIYAILDLLRDKAAQDLLEIDVRIRYEDGCNNGMELHARLSKLGVIYYSLYGSATNIPHDVSEIGSTFNEYEEREGTVAEQLPLDYDKFDDPGALASALCDLLGKSRVKNVRVLLSKSNR